MKLSELRGVLLEQGLLFEELLVLAMVRDMEAKRGEFDLGVRVMDVVNLAGSSELASPATAFKYIASLNNKNLIRKETDGGDRRASLVSVTRLGRDLLEKVDGEE
jgi:DNA-binding MarR family transcriptional regulator